MATSEPRPRQIAEHWDLHEPAEPSSQGAAPWLQVGAVTVGSDVDGATLDSDVVGSVVAGDAVGLKVASAGVGSVDAGDSVGEGVGLGVGLNVGLGVGAIEGTPVLGEGVGSLVVGDVSMASRPALMVVMSGYPLPKSSRSSAQTMPPAKLRSSRYCIFVASVASSSYPTHWSPA